MDTTDMMDIIMTALEKSDNHVKSVKKIDVPDSRTIVIVDTDGEWHNIYVN